MLTPTLTLTERDQQFIDAIRAVVAEAGPAHVYDRIGSCRYVRDGKPDCLIGRALARIGVSVERLADNEGTGAYEVMDSLGGFSHVVMKAAESAQDVQDGGAPWGYALQRFERALTSECPCANCQCRVRNP